ncbi:MAG: Gfo/Idh/MocA family oxidoreductase [Micropruina sp.]
MTEPIRWGIAGPGRMAAVIVPEFHHAANAELVAVGSRSAERAETFATEHGIPRWHSSYETLVEDPAVQAIYVATPHPQHTDIALAAIAAGKAVLVEKAFTATVADTERIAAAAREAGLFAMEAMWTRFNPAIRHISDLIERGEIGEVRGCQGDLTAFREFDPDDRLFDPAKGGGAVLDLGVYVISFAQHFLGTPDVVRAVGGRYSTGVEGEFSVLLGYPDGRSATLAGAFTTYGPGRMMLTGTKGWIDLHPRFHRAASVTIWRERTPETLEFDSGYRYEIEHVGECLAAGLTESPILPLDDTIAVQRIMAEVLDQI